MGRCEKKKHWGACLGALLGIAALWGAAMLLMKKTKKGRRIARRARRIGREVEELVANEFHFD